MWLTLPTLQNCRHVDGKMSSYGNICLIIFAVQTLFITAEMPTLYTRDQLLPLRAGAVLLSHDQRLRVTQLGLRRRGCRAGNHTRRSRQAARSVTSTTCCTSTPAEIPVVIGHRPLLVNNDQLSSCRRGERCRAESTACQCCSKTTRRHRRRQSHLCTPSTDLTSRCLQYPAIVTRRTAATTAAQQSRVGEQPLPSLYVLNAAALSKPHAVEHLAADLTSYNIDIAVIAETHFKSKHSDAAVNIPGYNILRRDRIGRRGGGVALYTRSLLHSVSWIPAAHDPTFEMQWSKIGNIFIGALYHPPKPMYKAELLLDHIEATVEEINRNSLDSRIVLAGDFNQLSDEAIIERTGLMSIVHQPTRGANILDRVYVSSDEYSTIRVVASTVRSDHSAVVAYCHTGQSTLPKSHQRRIYRPITPDQHAQFLSHLSTIDINIAKSENNVQAESSHFYSEALELLNRFYPEKTITVSSRDPPWMTASLKAKLRRKNRLMRKGRVEEASALAKRISNTIENRNRSRLRTRDGGKMDAKDVWAAVRRLTRRQRDAPAADGVSAEILNNHYALISTDPDYAAPRRKSSAKPAEDDYFSEWHVFRKLDGLRPTATGLDALPAWFLKLGAPVFYKPITRMYNLSIATSIVPQQWKMASIKPIPKVATPKLPADYRPISITPVLTRVMERLVVTQYLYPCFLAPPPSLSFADQYAFRPTGSPTAAIIHLLHTITHLLTTNSYVAVISLDFSKAFDTVRHYTLLDKLARLELPDEVYNWLVNFFDGHSHCTKFEQRTSLAAEVTASIIQGSAVGPAAYVVNASDLNAITPGNELVKFADDTYIVVPASNIHTRQAEIYSVEQWARNNNLTVNPSKYAEIVFRDNRRKTKVQPPPALPGIKQVTTIKILGITFTNSLSAAEHVHNVIRSSAQTLYALKVLRAHGMSDSALQLVYRAVVISKLTYASSAWCGFASPTDLQRIEAFIRRSERSRFKPSNLQSFADLCREADDSLFNNILHNSHHVLHHLLPPPSEASQHYSLRSRRHNLQLSIGPTSLTDRNFLYRMLYANSY